MGPPRALRHTSQCAEGHGSDLPPGLGFGFADLVRRPTASIKHISPRELRDAVAGLVERLSVPGKPLVVFTYLRPCEIAGRALERAGHRVLRMPSPYEPPDLLIEKLQMELLHPKAARP